MNGTPLDYIAEPALRGTLALVAILILAVLMGVVWGTSVHREIGFFAWILSLFLALLCLGPIVCRQAVEVDLVERKAWSCIRCLGFSFRLPGAEHDLRGADAVVLSATKGLEKELPLADLQRDDETYKVAINGFRMALEVHAGPSISVAKDRADEWASFLDFEVVVREAPDFRMPKAQAKAATHPVEPKPNSSAD